VGERIGRNLYHLEIHLGASTDILSEDLACFGTPKPTWIAVWNEILAHISHKRILKMASTQLVEGLKLQFAFDIPTHPCAWCPSGKMQRSPFPPGRTKADEIHQLIHADVNWPMVVQSPGGARNEGLNTQKSLVHLGKKSLFKKIKSLF
jgi:hypothetical protein